ncbi:hypothetical protein [Propionibacterium freudenreichii]|uniref:hypothetical protein n=2 Tax=Propionibacterium freudenreichii TaxID=1744 RepID=UPI0005420721|nr:hypothetical protein [Propionibacterium freudenreichii]MCT2997291.1 hypothetical protein [Propionibacterium freudenreichii]MDK9624310.1 hypothetical protein [Propionibacterium freudenreichii]MDK9645205.1 hypothetical protein [Propionibacterium freudenreichii]MDK9658168.1 hypothetical protein [Propionibacterium freudenreichii]MDK9671641.1 hypothetical protein [Propionibacterium freudenreichii]
MTKPWSRVVVAVLALLLVAGLVAAGVTGLFGGRSRSGSTPTSQASPATMAAGTATSPAAAVGSSSAPPDVAAGTQVLTRFPSEPSKYLAEQARDYFNVDPAAVLAPGTTIAVDSSSWTLLDETGAMVRIEVTVPGAAPTPYTAVMVKEADGAWKVMGTVAAQ